MLEGVICKNSNKKITTGLLFCIFFDDNFDNNNNFFERNIGN